MSAGNTTIAVQRYLDDLGQESVAEPIVRDYECTSLRVAQVLKADRRHLRPAEFKTGEAPPMPGDDVQVRVDQDRHIESESPNATGDLADLPSAVYTGIFWIEFEGGDGTAYNYQSPAYAPIGAS